MLDLAVLPIFLAGALALNLTPGPDMAFTLAASANAGRRAGLAAALGIMAGSMAWGLAAAGGVAALLAASDHALRVLQVAGGLYLVWLAIKTARRLDAAPGSHGAPSPRAAFLRGMTTNLLNPKVGAFFLAFLPAFTDPDIGPVWLQILTMAAIFSTTGGLVLAAVALGAGSVREHLVRSRPVKRTVNLIAAIAFGAIGLHLLASSLKA